ncbi:MAG TPA: hypothetical protein VHL11_17920 [Phototrophicaceae bacterium]|jgi:hypothetical protein|nr:hypothetical protein [Phototrophicaceae bacterium]
MLIHPANVYLGLRSASIVTDVKTPINLDVLSITPDSVPRSNQTVYLEVIQQNYVRKETSFGVYEWEYQELPIASANFSTDDQGHYSYHLYHPMKAVSVFEQLLMMSCNGKDKVRSTSMSKE